MREKGHVKTKDGKESERGKGKLRAGKKKTGVERRRTKEKERKNAQTVKERRQTE